jgi:hypothetical protein
MSYYTITNYCLKCHKQLTYIGDPPWPDGWAKGQEPFCTCAKDEVKNYDWSYPTYHYYWNNYPMNTGWICPRCNKVNAPHVSQCDCTKTKESEMVFAGTITGVEIFCKTKEDKDLFMVRAKLFFGSTDYFYPVKKDEDVK